MIIVYYGIVAKHIFTLQICKVLRSLDKNMSSIILYGWENYGKNFNNNAVTECCRLY